MKNIIYLIQKLHTNEFIKPNDKPSNVIRRGVNTSITLAIKSVKNQLMRWYQLGIPVL